MKRLMDRIGETVKGRIAEAELSPLEDEIRKYILKEFAGNGRPPFLEEIMKGLSLSSVDLVYQTIEKLQKFDVITKKKDKIVSAYPFSAAKTRHRVIFEDGHEVCALCATDALGIHFMLGTDITILSRCPECGKEMMIVVKGGKIDSFNPDGIIEFVSNRERGECTAETLCPFINFFCSEKDLEEWREKWDKIMEKFNLIILGSGSAAFGAAIKAVDLGARVAMIEKGTIGGTCVNVGCVPSKHLLRVGEINYYKNHSHTGLDVTSSLDFVGTINEKREIVKGLRKGRYIDVIDALGITLVRGEAETILSFFFVIISNF